MQNGADRMAAQFCRRCPQTPHELKRECRSCRSAEPKQLRHSLLSENPRSPSNSRTPDDVSMRMSVRTPL